MLFDGSLANEASRALDGNVMLDWLFSLCIVVELSTFPNQWIGKKQTGARKVVKNKRIWTLKGTSRNLSILTHKPWIITDVILRSLFRAGTGGKRLCSQSIQTVAREVVRGRNLLTHAGNWSSESTNRSGACNQTTEARATQKKKTD